MKSFSSSEVAEYSCFYSSSCGPGKNSQQVSPPPSSNWLTMGTMSGQGEGLIPSGTTFLQPPRVQPSSLPGIGLFFYNFIVFISHLLKCLLQTTKDSTVTAISSPALGNAFWTPQAQTRASAASSRALTKSNRASYEKRCLPQIWLDEEISKLGTSRALWEKHLVHSSEGTHICHTVLVLRNVERKRGCWVKRRSWL